MLWKFPFNAALTFIGVMLLPSLATAAINLKKVNIVDGNQIELLFDSKIDANHVKTEFVRDNIQLSLSNASVYPAKVSMVSGSDLTKVFAYQYAPSLVRARFTVKGDASAYANRLQVKFSGKSIFVKIAPKAEDHVASAASSAVRSVSAPETERLKEKESPATADKADQTEQKAEKKKAMPLSGGKNLPSPLRSIGMMLFVLGVFGLFVMFLKRLKGRSGKVAQGAKSLGGFLNKLSGTASSKEIIEVVATHHLAPKRSIVVVRVQDRMLVLGMTNDNMNLITEFRANEEGEADENIPLGDFAASLKKFESEEPELSISTKISPKANLGDIAAAALGLAKPKPSSAPRATAATNAYRSAEKPTQQTTGNSALDEAMKQPSVKPNIRAQIKDRVQGMKRL